MSVEYCSCGVIACREGRSTIKAEPANPEQASACHSQRRAVGRKQGFVEAFAFANQFRDDECSDASGSVNHNTAREIERTKFRQPAAAPDPACDGHIDEQAPQR